MTTARQERFLSSLRSLFADFLPAASASKSKSKRLSRSSLSLGSKVRFQLEQPRIATAEISPLEHCQIDIASISPSTTTIKSELRALESAKSSSLPACCFQKSLGISMRAEEVTTAFKCVMD